jgi:hypothetical protein
MSKFQGLVRLEGLGKLKKKELTLGLELTTFRLIAYYLSQLIKKNLKTGRRPVYL